MQIAIGAVGDPFYKIAAEALHVLSNLVYSLRPDLAAPLTPAHQPLAIRLFETVAAKMAVNESGQEIKEAAMLCVAHAVAVLGEEATLARVQCLPTLLTRMINEVCAAFVCKTSVLFLIC
jgi:hypothetical protein